MSVKKLLVLSAAGIAAVGMTAAIAGGPDQMVAPAPVFQPKVYIEGHVGYVKLDWRRFEPALPVAFTGDNSRGGFAAGGDLGYWFQRYIAFELGSFYLNCANGVFGNRPVQVTSWFAYGAFKFIVPMLFVPNLDFFGKIGVAWRQNRYNIFADGDFWNPVFAVGLQYVFNETWSLAFQYMYIPGNNEGGPFTDNAPNASLFTVALGYMFAV